MTSNGHADWDISFVRAATVTETQHTTFRAVLSDIANGRYRPQVDAVRTAYAEGGKKAADAPKKKLPAVLFSGTFHKRSAAALTEHSGLICADLDELGASLESYRDLIVADPHTLACFRSPSGVGLKVIFKCDPTADHADAFRAAEHYIADHFGLMIDQACKDVSRLCFVSDDPEAFVADDAIELPYVEPPKEFVPAATPTHAGTGLTPADAYDRTDDWKAVLRKHGWNEVYKDHWARPEKGSGISATWDRTPGHPLRFYPFSSSAAPFRERHLYKPWNIYALLEHGGDFSAAAKALYARGFGDRMVPTKKSIQPPDELNLDGPPPQAAATIHSAQPIAHVLRPLFSIPLVPPGDGSILLGNRYLNRGDGAVIVSSSGMGKSAMCLQMATELALNIGPFGIQGNGPLRSLIVQSEDGDGDLAEVTHSIRHVMKLTDEQVRLAEERVMIATDGSNRGPRFLQALKASIAATKPDLVWLNPLQAFMAGDVTDGEDISEFLREGLNGLNADRSFGYIIVHHTTKPATGKERAERLWHEVMYDMAGGAEIINWARAILSLRPTPKEGNFNLVLAKRGRRAGVTKEVPHGVGVRLEPVTIIPLKHAAGHFPTPYGDLPTIFWESRPEDEPTGDEPKKAGAPAKYQFSEFRGSFPAKKDLPKRINEIYQIVTQNCPGLSNKHFYNLISRWREDGFIEQVTETGIHRYRMAL